MGKRGRAFIGTSGWVYREWEGIIYPKKVKGGDSFLIYRRVFDTVELNSTFYHFPLESTVLKWKKMAGKDFIWSVKAWGWITHRKKLKDAREGTAQFLERVRPLTGRGVLLFQLPPSQGKNLEKLEAFLKILPKRTRIAFEFRHNSWFDEDTYRLLRKYRAALVGVDAPGIHKDYRTRTARFAYFRLHGAKRWYVHNYSEKELRSLADAAKEHLKRGDIYIYFDNTANGDAFRNALRLKKILKAY